MKFLTFILTISLLLMLGCNEQVKEEVLTIEEEVNQLTTLEAKRLYLEKIHDDDQSVRDNETSAALVSKYGRNSEEYMNFVRRQWKQDSLNLERVEKYLSVYGHPTKEMGHLAAGTPWLVIHHAQGFETRVRNFERIYEAYLKGDIDDGAISFYLGRMYEVKNDGKRLRMKSPYKPDDEINLLIKELGLEKKQARVVQKMKNS
ncbi:MAG TPA: hypothetical protein ENJ45_04275 [Phaeodactylibacter sp.]|nr:hypothetical protein [Phaeodactylibacter sp.]